MIISEIEMKLIGILINNVHFISAEEIAKEISVSNKTVYRAVDSLNNKFGKNFIISERGKGYQINYEIYYDIIDGSTTFDTTTNNFSVKSRRISIMINLLMISPDSISINTLSEKYYVAPSSIVNDFKYIEQRFKETKLELRKTYKGTSVVGDEKDIRNELNLIFNDILSKPQGIFNGVNYLIDSNSSTILRNKFSVDEINLIHRIMREAMEILGYTIENPYYTNLQTHLLVLLKRNKEKIEEKQQYAIDMNSKEYQAATYIKTEIEKYLDNLLNTYEINYIYSLIVSSRTKYFDYSEEDSPDELAKAQEFVNELIDIIDNQFKKLNFKQDKILEKQLLQHAIPMLKRNRFNIEIKNPLLDSIRKQFSSVYKKIEIATKDLEAKYDLIDITSDEIGYLTLYFQNAIERQNQNINVLIVCSTGIGSSHLLKTRVTNNFSHFHIVGTCSAHELSEYEDQDVDLILSTVRLKNTDKPYLLVSAILNQADINLINRFIDDNYGGI